MDQRRAMRLAGRGIPEPGSLVRAGREDESAVGAPDGRQDAVGVPQKGLEGVGLSAPASEVRADRPLKITVVFGDKPQALRQPEQPAAHVTFLTVTQPPVAKQAGREPLVQPPLHRLATVRLQGGDPLPLFFPPRPLGAGLRKACAAAFPGHQSEGDQGARHGECQQSGHARPAPRPPRGSVDHADRQGAHRLPGQVATEILGCARPALVCAAAPVPFPGTSGRCCPGRAALSAGAAEARRARR